MFINLVHYIPTLSCDEVNATVHLGDFFYLIKEGCVTTLCETISYDQKSEGVSLTIDDLQSIDTALHHVEHAAPEMTLLTPYFCFI